MPPPNPSPEIVNARYVAIRAAETRGLTDRLLQATRDKTPGVRPMLVPLLYRFWKREPEQGWQLLARIGDDVIAFYGLPDAFAMETFAEVSLAILNACRNDHAQLDRLAGIWRALVERMFATRVASVLGGRMVMRLLARPIIHVLQRQPAFQPLNFRELQATFARPDDFRAAWRAALVCLDRPERGAGVLAEILTRRELPFDVYLMLLAERTLIYHGVKVDPPGTFALLDRLFTEGCPWFRQSVLYSMFHMLANLPEVEDPWLDRYVAIAEEFFVSNSWRMRTAVAQYNFAGHLGWPELVIDQHRRASPPRVLPRLMQRAVKAGDAEEIEGLFGAIDSIGFSYGRVPLALNLLERALETGGAALEERVLKSLANVRLQDQPQLDAYIEEHRLLMRLHPRVESVEPTIREEDMPSLLDGLTVQLILSSDYFRGRVCDAFRRAIEARNVPQFLVQVLQWLRDEFTSMTPSAS
jgi:hypothetical protein